MAPSSHLQQKVDDGAVAFLDLDLSLGGLFSQPKNPVQIHRNNEDRSPAPLLPFSVPSGYADTALRPSPSSSSPLLEDPHPSVNPMKPSHPQRQLTASAKRWKGSSRSQDIKQQKRARRDTSFSSVSSPSVTNSGSCYKAYSSYTDSTVDQSVLPSDMDVRRCDVHSMPSNRTHDMLPDMKKAMVTEVSCGFGIGRKSALDRPNLQETPTSFAAASSHSPTFSCTSCIHTHTTSSNTPSSYSSTEIASCPSFNLSLTTAPSSDAPMPKIGSKAIVNHMLPSKRKSSNGDEEGKSCHSSLSDLESGDNLDEESTTRKKITELEAPRSRCGSNSDMIGSMGSSAAIPSNSSMMYNQVSQGPFSMPIQWGTLSYAMHYSYHMMPPSTLFPCISLFHNSASGSLQPGVPAASRNQGKIQNNLEISSNEDALTFEQALETPSSPKEERVQDVSEKRGLPPPVVHEIVPRSLSDTCASALLLRPSTSLSPMSNCSSDVWTSSSQPLISSSMSPTTNYLNDLHKQADLEKRGVVNEVCRSRASKLSASEEDCSNSPCPQKSNDAGPAGNVLCGQSKHSISPASRKPTKTVRFSSDEKELVKSMSEEADPRIESSSLLSESRKINKPSAIGNPCKSRSVNKLQTLRGEAFCSHNMRYDGGVVKRAAQECEHEEGSANSRVSAITLDQGESVPSNVKRAGKFDGKNTSNLPRVSTTCAGPNGKTIYGVMYITKSKQACLICSCHGTHMSPSEFVQHSGSTDLRNPERNIVVTGFSCVKQVV